MRQIFLLFLLTTVVIGSMYWYQGNVLQCPVPLSYSIGSIDESFDLDEAAALGHVDSAVSLWEDTAGRDLFVYDKDEKADVTIDFVFDERQQEANSEERFREILDTKKDQNESVIDTVESMQARHQELFDDYQSRVTNYEQRLADYNQRVLNYNDQGGAPSDVFAELEEERIELNQTAEELSETAVTLNQLAEDINELGERGGRLIEEYNEDVDAYNERYGFSREFTQGDYQDGVINIYKFSSTEELVTVLAHEFGHALGIGHVDDSSSLMYYLLEDTVGDPVLTEVDLAAFYEICGARESVGQKISRAVREFIRNQF